MQPTIAAHVCKRPISPQDEELRVYLGRPERSFWVTPLRFAASLVLGIAVGAAAWESYAYLAAKMQQELPARTKSATLTPTPVSVPQCASRNSKTNATEVKHANKLSATLVSAAIHSHPTAHIKQPCNQVEPEFNEDF